MQTDDLPFSIGALYSRRTDIHGRFGGQLQSGIVTPAAHDVIVLFTGESGKAHGYLDHWDDAGIFHYYGEGQLGDMRLIGGNAAIANHLQTGKRLILFQSMGRGQPYRYLGEFTLLSHYEDPGILDREGNPRTALVFRLIPVEAWDFEVLPLAVESPPANPTPVEGPIEEMRSISVRTKQSLFRRRLAVIEKGCRITGIRDLRFLRASHIKPWSACESKDEKVDGYNGLLLCPQADLLFDHGWITFAGDGELIRSRELPEGVIAKLGLDLTPGRYCGDFFPEQRTYLDFHRAQVFEKGSVVAARSLDAVLNREEIK